MDRLLLLKSLANKDNGGGVRSWNELEDKPFGEEKAFEPIVWDGNTEGLESVVYDEVTFYKVSDEPIADPTDIKTFLLSDGAGTSANDPVAVGVTSQPFGFVVRASLISVTEDTDLDGGILAKGLWFSKIINGSTSPNGLFTAGVNPKTTIKPLDEKYLPEDISGGVKSWNDLKDKPFGEDVEYEHINTYLARMGFYLIETSSVNFVYTPRVGFSLATLAEGETYRVTISGHVFEGVYRVAVGQLGIGNPFVLGARSNQSMTYEEIIAAGYEDTGEDFWIWGNAGEVIITREAFVETAVGTKPDVVFEKVIPVLKKLDPKYLPNDNDTVVFIECSWDDNYGGQVPSMTYDEINSAFYAGKTLWLKANSDYLPLSLKSSSGNFIWSIMDMRNQIITYTSWILNPDSTKFTVLEYSGRINEDIPQ